MKVEHNIKLCNRIYISGCGGMLGEAFYKHFNAEYTIRCSDIDLNDRWLDFCDIRDFDGYKKDVFEFCPDYLFHLGAFTDLEYCERHPDETYITNTLAVEHAVHIANALHIPLLYVSTAGIFDGNKLLYDDWDTPNPMGVYARSKYDGEVFVERHAERFLICRAGWMMGGGPSKDKKFVQKIMRQLKEGRKTLNIVNDKLGTPTYTHDFASSTGELIKRELWGLYNMVCEGETGRLEVAKEIVALAGLKERVVINEVSSAYFKDEYYAPRPDSERLVNKKLSLSGVNLSRNWKVALKEYIETYYSNYL